MKNNRRILRTKRTLAFGSKLVLPAGDYEGDAIPRCLEEEFELGSPHVEEVNIRSTRIAEDDEKTPAQKAAETRAKNKAEKEAAEKEAAEKEAAEQAAALAEQEAQEAEDAAAAADAEEEASESDIEEK